MGGQDALVLCLARSTLLTLSQDASLSPKSSGVRKVPAQNSVGVARKRVHKWLIPVTHEATSKRRRCLATWSMMGQSCGSTSRRKWRRPPSTGVGSSCYVFLNLEERIQNGSTHALANFLQCSSSSNQHCMAKNHSSTSSKVLIFPAKEVRGREGTWALCGI